MLICTVFNFLEHVKAGLGTIKAGFSQVSPLASPLTLCPRVALLLLGPSTPLLSFLWPEEHCVPL